MSGHLTHQELVGFRYRTVGPQQMLRVDRHLASCGLCRRKLRAAVPAPEIPSIAVERQELAHLSYEQICAYLDGGQDAAGREETESHAAICSMCAAEIADLKAFDTRMAAEAEQVSTAPQAAKEGLLARLAGFFEAPQRLRFVGASLSLVLVGAIVMSRIPETGGAGDQGTSLLFHITHAAPTYATEHYVGLALVLLGLAGILYRIFK